MPRPETEYLVRRALDLDLPPAARVVDVGTGSGAIAVTLAAERPSWRVLAVDRSAAALAMARANAARHGAGLHLVRGDLATAVAGGLHLVVANLPYLPSASLDRLPVEVGHDPRAALDGGLDGLDLVRRLVADLARLLTPGGRALLELAEDQADTVAALALAAGLAELGRERDAGGCDRVLMVGGGALQSSP